MPKFTEWLFSTKQQREAWVAERMGNAPEVHLAADVDTAVAGTSLRQDAIPAEGGYTFELVPEPTNRVDRNAIKVMHQGAQVGYLRAETAAWYGDLVRRHVAGHAVVHVSGEVRPTGRDGERWVLVYLPRLGREAAHDGSASVS